MDPNLNIQPFLQPFDIGAQAAEGQEFLSGLGAAIPRIRGQIESQLGLPGLRELQAGLGEAITGVTGQIRGVPDVVAGTTQQSLVTDPQRQRLVAKQQEPLREQLVRLAESQAAIAPQLAATEQLAERQFGAQLLPFQMGFSLLEQRQAREFTGYSEGNQLELNRLIANLNAGVTLTEGEKNRLAELAIKEKQFENNLQQIRLTGEQQRETKKAPADLASLFQSIFG